jgi:hypothetical protein
MTDYAIPSELTYSDLSRLYPSRKMELRRQPFNASSFQQGNMIQITIPKMDKSFLNCATNCLTFNCAVTLTAGATNQITTADNRVYFYGNAWAPFRRYVLKQSGGQDLDQLDNVNVLVNKLMDITTNPTEKLVNIAMGFHNANGSLNVGHEFIPSANIATGASATITASFSIPLIGILGQTEKFIPLNTADLEINLTVEQITEAICRNALPTDATVSYTISNVEFVGEVLQLEDSGYQQLLAMYPDGLKVKTQSWSYASGGSLPAQANGVQDLVVPFSLSSLKQFLWSSNPSTSFEGKFGGVNPNLSSYQLLIGGSPYPVQPVNASRVAEVYYQNSKAFGAFYSAGHSGSATRTQFAKSSTATGEYSAFTTSASVTTQAHVETEANQNKFVCAVDLEMINQSRHIYNGVSSRGSTNTLRLNIGSQIANTSHAVHMFAGYDVQLTFDWRNGQILYSN